MVLPSKHRPGAGAGRPAIAVAAGGTAGHAVLGLAVAGACRRQWPQAEILFLGAEQGAEGRLVASCGLPFLRLPASPFQRQPLGGKLAAVVNAARSVAQARRLLRRHRVRLVVGAGGYVTVGPLLAARSLGVATAILEPNAVPGLANRLLGRWADRIFLGFDATARYFPAARLRVTGTPVRPEIDRAAAARRHRPPPAGRPRRVLITAGSEGSSLINDRLPPVLGRVGLPLEVRHQVGEGDPQAVRRAYREAAIAATVGRYFDDLPASYRWADLAISAAGASTLAELALCALPAILVPRSGVAEDHQRANARLFAELAGVPWVDAGRWHDAELAAEIAALLSDSGRWRDAAVRLERLARPGAAARIAASCRRLVEGSGTGPGGRAT